MSYLPLRSNTFTTSSIYLMHLMVAITFIAAAAIKEQPTIEGNYSGNIFVENETEKIKARLTVTALGRGEYEAVLYLGELPGERENSNAEMKTVQLRGKRANYTLRLKGNFPLVFQFIHNRFTALDESNTYRGHLEKVIGVSAKN